MARAELTLSRRAYERLLADLRRLLEAGRGQRARDFVRDALTQVEFVVVKTHKVDLYGRYVGHIFYAPGVDDEQLVFAQGRYLNQELVDKGLAAIV